MAKLFEYQQRVERIYYNHGMFVSNHPILMIGVSAIIILLCCYPLLNLPLPGSEPSRFITPLPSLASVKTVGHSLPYGEGDGSLEVPHWFHPSLQVAYVQQFLVKSVVNPWKEEEMIPSDAYRAPLSKLFTLLEEIENFHLEDEKESHSVTAECLHVTETIIKQGNRIKPVFPEYGCLILSPASFWKKNPLDFQTDPNILHTMSKYIGKAIETSPSIKELIFGVPSKECGVTNFIVRNRQRVITYAVTVVLKSYDSKMLKSLKEKIESLYPSKMQITKKEKGCDPEIKGENCENSSDSGGSPTITHIHFKSQIGIYELIPLLSTYFIMGCYIYFSVRKINFVKSKLGMAFSAVVSIMASLMMSVGLCSLFGLTPTLNGGEIFPYLIIVIGLENILVITKSVVATPIHLDVDRRIALGISREGCSIMKNLLLELVVIGLGYFTFVPEIQEFCAFAVVGILSDYFMHVFFFTTVLSIDIRRLDITEDIYSQPESDDEVESPEQPKSWLYPDLETSHNEKSRKKSVLEHLRLANRRKKKGPLDIFHKVESGGKSVTILKLPKRLRVLFFWADTRMVQRLLMVCMIIWIAILMYSDPFGNKRHSSVNKGPEMRIRTGPPVPPIHSKESNVPDFDSKKTSSPSPNNEVNLMWSGYDLDTHQRLSFRHWPTLFAYYNITLAGRFVSILPPIPLTVLVTPEEAKKARHSSETAKHDSRIKDQGSLPSDMNNVDENLSQQLPPYRYPMTGLDYYLTLLMGAVAGVIMVFSLTVMYKCICTRNYANWRTHSGRRRRVGEAKYTSSIGDSMPLVLSGHPQLVECLTVDGPLLVSADLSGEVRVWDIHSGDCTCVIHRIMSPLPHRDPAEGAIDAIPTPGGHQEKDLLYTFPYVNSCPTQIDTYDNQINQYSRSNLTDNMVDLAYEDKAVFEKGHSRHRSWNAPAKTHNRSRSGDGMAAMFNQQPGQVSFEKRSMYSPNINLSSTIQTQFLKLASDVKSQQIRKRNIPLGQRNDDNGLDSSNYNDNASSEHPSRGSLELGEGDSLKRQSSGELSTEDDVSKNDRGYNFQELLNKKFAEHQNQYPDQYSGDPMSTTPRYPYGRLAQSRSQPHNNNHVNQYYPRSQPVSPSTPNSIHSPSMNKHSSLINRREITGRYSSPTSPNSLQQTNLNPQMGTMDDSIYRMWGSWESGLGAATPLSGPASWGSMPDSPLEMENGPSVWCLVCIKNFVIAGCENGRIEVWDSITGVIKCSHDVGKAGVCGLVAEETKLVAARINGCLDFFSMEATRFHPTPVQYRGTTRSRNDSGKTMDDLMCDDVLILQLVYTVKSAHQQPITAFKMARGRVLTGSCDHTLKLFTVQDARCLYTLFGHASAITALYMDQGPPAGAASGSSDGTVRIWDLPTGECLHKFDEHKGEVTAVQCTEMHVISAGQDDKLCVWARRTGMLLHVRCLDTGCSSGMCLLGNSWCVTGGLGCVLLWDIRNGDLVRRIRLSDDSHGPSSRVNQIVPVANLSVACDVGKELRIVFFPAVLEKVD